MTASGAHRDAPWRPRGAKGHFRCAVGHVRDARIRAAAAGALLLAATVAHAKGVPYVGVITWNDGTTATLRTRQRPGRDFHAPPYTFGSFRCRGACPTRRGRAYLLNAFSAYGPAIVFDGPEGNANGPTCFLTYAGDVVDPVTGCERDRRTLHCSEAGRDAPPDGAIVITTRPCRAILTR